MCANPTEIWLQIGFRTFPVEAQVIADPAEARRTIECLILESPDSAKRLFGWDPKSTASTRPISPRLSKSFDRKIDEQMIRITG